MVNNSYFAAFLVTDAHALLTSSTPFLTKYKDIDFHYGNVFQAAECFKSPKAVSSFLKSSYPYIGNGSFRSQPVELHAGFLDDLFQGNFFQSSKKEQPVSDDETFEENEALFSEANFQKELQKRNKEMTTKDKRARFSNTMAAVKDEVDMDGDKKKDEFDGYDLRDAIYAKWGYCFDINFQPVQSFGFKELYLNVLPFRMGSKRFRHETELDYLCHLQAVVEILIKYDQLDHVLAQLEETEKKPRAGTVPIIAVPFRLDLTEDELDTILA